MSSSSSASPPLPDSTTSDCDIEEEEEELRSLEMVLKLTERRKPRKKRIRPQFLWQFLRDMILNPKYYPKVIRWVDKKQYTFLIVQPGVVAKMWGIQHFDCPLDAKNLYKLLTRNLKLCFILPVAPEKFIFKFNRKIMNVKVFTTKKKLDDYYRYYYKKKILLPGLGNRLVYTFGPHGVAWRKYTPPIFKQNL